MDLRSRRNKQQVADFTSSGTMSHYTSLLKRLPTIRDLWRMITFVGPLVLALLVFSCEKLLIPEPKPEQPNAAPSTSLANLPAANDTLSSLTTLYWDGHDNDGYVVAFQYQYITYPLGPARGDSIVHDWTNTENHLAAITFSSPDPVNRQVFRVRAVDNTGNVDPVPATRVFYTLQTIAPATKILSPTTGTEFYAVSKTSYWFPGVVVSISAQVPWSPNPVLQGSVIIKFGWSADNGPMHWVPAEDSVVTISPQDFKQPLSGDHSIHVTSQSNTLMIDPVGATITVKLVEPTFQKDIVILDDTRTDASIRNVPKPRIDSLYQAAFGYNNSYSIDIRDLQTRAFPSRTILGNYKLVVWHHDDGNIPFYMGNDVAIKTMTDYLHVGGKLIICGTRTWEHWLPPADPTYGLPHPFSFSAGSFVHDYLHIEAGDQSTFQGSFSGATGVGGFSDVSVDTSRMNAGFPQYGKPGWVGVVARKGPFTREILLFKDEDPNVTGLPCGIRYYGDSYDITWLGFPLWALKSEDARTLAQQILRSMGY
jgi:hypothetical protein